VAELYAARINVDTAVSCCGDNRCGSGYHMALLGSMPEGVVSYGCGNPTALASIAPGERALDLGSGAGQVGAEGHVIGVDFTPAMLERARARLSWA